MMHPAAFIGGMVGALVGAGIWLWWDANHVARQTDWGPMLIGFLAGVGARVLAEPIAENRLRGAIIMAIALSAMIATQMASNYFVTQRSMALDAGTSQFTNTRSTGREPAQDPEARPGDESGRAMFPADGGGVTGADPHRPDAPQPDTGNHGQPIDPEGAAGVSGGRPQPGRVELPLVSSTPDPSRTRLLDPAVVIALSYAVGGLLAYFIGKGPADRTTHVSNPSR